MKRWVVRTTELVASVPGAPAVLLVVHYHSRLARLVLKPFGFAAICLGRHVFTWEPSLRPQSLAHEAVHAEQWARYGVLGFLARYLWYQLRYGYAANPLEREAYQRAAAQGLSP
jgi:hypothetical protein